MTLRDRVLEVARSTIGTTEHPPGSNRTPFGAWYAQRSGAQFQGVAWCAVWNCWVYAHAGVGDLRDLLTPDWAYTPAGTAAARAKGWTVPTADIRAGDILQFDFPGGESTDHTGIATGPPSAGYVPTIEGNTSSGAAGSQSNGGGVWARRRPLAQVRTVIRVPALDDDTPPDDIPSPSTPEELPVNCFLSLKNVGLFVKVGDVVAGLGLAEYARSAEQSPHIPVVVIDDQAAAQAVLAGLLKAQAKATTVGA